MVDISTGVVAVSSLVDTLVGALTLVKEVKSDPRGFLPFCIVVLLFIVLYLMGWKHGVDYARQRDWVLDDRKEEYGVYDDPGTNAEARVPAFHYAHVREPKMIHLYTDCGRFKQTPSGGIKISPLCPYCKTREEERMDEADAERFRQQTGAPLPTYNAARRALRNRKAGM